MTTEDGTHDYVQFLRQRGIITHIVSGNSGEKIPTETLMQDCVAHDVACPVPLPDGTVGINFPDGIPDALAALNLSIEAIDATGKVPSEPGNGQDSVDATLDEIEAALTGTDAALNDARKIEPDQKSTINRSDLNLINSDVEPVFQDVEDTAWDRDAAEIGLPDKTAIWDAADASIAPSPKPEPAFEEPRALDTADDEENTTLEDIDVAEPDPLVAMMDEVLCDDEPMVESELASLDRNQLNPGESKDEADGEPDVLNVAQNAEFVNTVQPENTDDTEHEVGNAKPNPSEDISAPDLGTDPFTELGEKISRMMTTQDGIVDRLDRLTKLQDTPDEPSFDAGTDRLTAAFSSALLRFNEAPLAAGKLGHSASLTSNGSDVRILANLQEIIALQMANLLENQAPDTDPALIELIMDLRHAVTELALRQPITEQYEKPSDYLSRVNAA